MLQLHGTEFHTLTTLPTKFFSELYYHLVVYAICVHVNGNSVKK